MTLEGQARHFFPAFRIFIFGQEVSEDVLSCRINLNDARAPSTAEFQLTSELDRYIMEAKDIAALNPEINLGEVELPDMQQVLDVISDAVAASNNTAGPTTISGSVEQARAKAIDAVSNEYKTRTQTQSDDLKRLLIESVQDQVRDEVKRRVLTRKVVETVPVSQPSLTQTGTQKIDSADQLKSLRGEASRYPFQQGDCIFHSNDPVRIFWRDPRNPEVWYHMFSGFVTDWTDDVDENNTKLVTIRCEDVLRIFRYARITTNPGIFDIKAIQQVEDGIIRTFFNEGFANLTLPEFIYTLIFGSVKAATTALLGSNNSALTAVRSSYNRVGVEDGGTGTTTDVPNDGIGSFTFERSVTFIFGPDDAAQRSSDTAPIEEVANREVRLRGDNALAVYQAVIDHQVRPSDLETMVLRGEAPIDRSGMLQDPRTAAPQLSEVIRAIGAHPELYPVDAGRLVMLLPASLGPGLNRNLLFKDLIQTIATSETTFRDRLSMIFDVLARLEFSFFASPRGDLLLECPLYDFEPDDFGASPVTRNDVLDAFKDAKISIDQVGLAFDPGEERGPFAPHFKIAAADTVKWQRSFSDERMRTVVASHWTIVPAYPTIGDSKVIGQPPKVTVLRALVPQFGVRMETIDTHGSIATPEAAQIYTAIKLNQLNADARSAQVEVIPQLRVLPNRPLLFSERNYIATVRSVDHSIVWNSDMSMSLGVNYVRGWSGLKIPGTNLPLYAAIGGTASRPLNYSLIFKPSRAAASSATPNSNTPTENAALNAGNA